MDLVKALTGALGIDDTQAQAVAGAVLANVQGQVEDETEGTEVEEQLDSAVPELGGWLDTAKSMTGAGGVTDLLGAVAGKKAQNAALLAAVLGKVGLDESKAMMAAPLVLQFLESRMDKATLDKILAVAPILTGTAPKAGAGGLMGGLGSLLG